MDRGTRETLRRDAVDTLARLAQLREHDNPEQALAVLECTITVDRYQNPCTAPIMTIQGRLGRDTPEFFMRRFRTVIRSLKDLQRRRLRALLTAEVLCGMPEI